MGAMAFPAYERLTILDIPPLGNPQDVLDDFDKLDLWSTRVDSDYPVDDINYNEGKPKLTHPFHKISKHYGRNKDVFLFLDTIRNDKLKDMIMRKISERCRNDGKIIDDFAKKMRTYINRTSRGEVEAEGFLNDPELHAFFNGYHSEQGGRTRNMHENLNINVKQPVKALETGGYFTKITPLMKLKKSELKRAKIYANGERVMIIQKEEGEKRNYLFTKHRIEMDLEIGWSAKNDKEEHLMCVIILNIRGGRAIIKKMAVEGQSNESVLCLSELAKQNPNVLLKNKSLHELLNNMLVQKVGKADIQVTCMVQPLCRHDEKQMQSREKLTVQQLPKLEDDPEKDVFADFNKLIFSSGPFPSSDELNYNDGVDANPFDKISRVYGRHKDIFAFNDVIASSRKREKIMDIVRGNCDEEDEDTFRMVQNFERKMDTYYERFVEGREDAKAILEDKELQGFFHGSYITKQGQPRNIHATLNVNLTKNEQSVDTKAILTRVIPKMISEKSEVERIKIFGNGKRIMNVVKGVNGQRNYTFSKLAKMDLEIEWVGKEQKTDMPVLCCMVLDIKSGQIGMKYATIDGVYVKLATMHGYASGNKQVLIRNKTLSKALEDIISTLKLVAPFTIGSIKAKIQPVLTVRNIPFDCKSREILTIHQLTLKPFDLERFFELPEFRDVLEDFEKLDFSGGPFDPSDVLNHNEGIKTNPFNKIRKYYGKFKDIFLFIALLYDDDQKEKVMNIVRRKCKGDRTQIAEFEGNMRIFLERAHHGRRQAMEFLGEQYRRSVIAFFAGSQMSDPTSKRNLHANLNIDLGESGLSFDITDYFNRPTPRTDTGKGELERIKMYGNGKRIVTIFKKSGRQRNYLVTKFAEMDLDIKWNVQDSSGPVAGPSTQNPGCSRSIREIKECAVLLKIRNGDVAIAKASLDGNTVQPAEILELAKQNDKVWFKNKTLYEILQVSTLKATIKGATTLFFTAAGGGDATKLKNSCTDVFLMLMLQDQEEKERILELAAKQSGKPIETREELEERMADFKKRFDNGDYVFEAGCYLGMRSEEESENLENERSIAQLTTLLDGIAVGNAAEVKGAEAIGNNTPTVDDNENEECEIVEGAAALAPERPTSLAIDDFVVIGEKDLVDDDADDEDESPSPRNARESLILLGAAEYPIELM